MLNQRDALGPAALAVFTLAVFSSALGNEFLNWDDVFFLHGNRALLDFDLPSLLSQRVVGIYHPVTMLSLALEHRLFGLDPFWFHLDNVLLHALNAVLVVLLLRRLCADYPFLALLGGTLFAVHPLRAESVAWVAERKDLLATCFFLSAVLAYLRFRERGDRGWYVACFLLYVLALFSKPMAVTAPLVMWLSDRRFAKRPTARVLLELAPFLALACVVGVLAIDTQAHHPDERVAIYELDLVGRLGVGLQSLVFYVSKTLLPLRLSAYYDFDSLAIEPYRYALAAAGLGWMVFAALRPGDARQNYRWALLFFLITVAPVSKIIPFGGHSLFNDRYTYLPGIGLVLALALPFRGMWSWSPPRRGSALAAWSLVVLALAFSSHERAKVFRSSETLWLDVLRKYPDTAAAHNNLGRHYLDDLGDLERARRAFEAAALSRPDFAKAELNLGIVEERSGDLGAAARHFERALELAPYDASLQIRAGLFYQGNGVPLRAVECYRAAIELAPDSPLPYHNLGELYLSLGALDAARDAYERAIVRAPQVGETRVGLAEVLVKQGHPEQALTSYEAALERGAQVDAARLETLRAELRAKPRL